MAFAFFRNMLGVKSDQAVSSAIEALVRFDPKSASEAELRTMEQNLDSLGLQVAEARREYDREQREADQIGKLFDERMAAAEHIQAQIETASPENKAKLEGSLQKLIGIIEEMTPEIERERAEAADALEFLTMLETNYNQVAGKLKTARSDLTKAQRDMTRAERQREMAESRAEGARQAAGFAEATGSLNVALKAMTDAAAKDRAHAESAALKAKALSPSDPEKDDPTIAAAMASVSGAVPKATSLNDRLAALRQKKG